MKRQQTVVFDKVSLNEGNAYDKTSGIFTAPFDGIYFFIWTTLSSHDKYFLSEIVRNGQPIALNWTDGRGVGGHGSDSSTSHAIIKMKKGDKVWIRVHVIWGQYVKGGTWCSFSGVKL